MFRRAKASNQRELSVNDFTFQQIPCVGHNSSSS
jgi:hypothetical protein